MPLRLILRLLPVLFPALLLPGCVGIPLDGGHRVADIGPAYGGINSYVVVDASEGKVLLSRQADQRRPVASLTKIATAAVVLEYIAKSGGSTEEMIVVPPAVRTLGASSPVGLMPGDAIATRDALYCAMMALR